MNQLGPEGNMTGDGPPVGGDPLVVPDRVIVEAVVEAEWSWTQPQCKPCFDRDNPGRKAVALRHAKVEICVSCGAGTQDGIYIRVDPKVARFPSLEKDNG